jgi:ATP-dependent DNA ligase
VLDRSTRLLRRSQSSSYPAASQASRATCNIVVLFAFDLLHLNGESTAALPLVERKARLQRLRHKMRNHNPLVQMKERN